MSARSLGAMRGNCHRLPIFNTSVDNGMWWIYDRSTSSQEAQEACAPGQLAAGTRARTESSGGHHGR